MPKRGKRSRRNRRGSGIFCNDEKGPSYFDRIKNTFSSWTGSTAVQNNQPAFQQPEESVQQFQPQYQSPAQYQSPNQSYLGGKRRKRRTLRKGGAPAAPYNPATVWSNASPFPQAVGGRRTKKRGGSQPMPYGPEVWSNASPFPQAVGGKKRKTHTRRR